MRRIFLLIVFFGAVIASFMALESTVPAVRTITKAVKTPFGLPAEAEVLFVGDMMFDRYIRTVHERGGTAFGDVAPLMRSSDMVVGNLEGPITDTPSQSQGTKVGDLTNMRFTFSPAILELLLDHHVALVSIGNNHIRDFGTEGVRSTTAYLRDAGVAYVGDPTDSAHEPNIQVINGIRIAFVSYSDFVSGDAARARDTIASASADLIVVLAHWGTEYESEPPPRIRELARSFADAGADLIIGTHPHVIGAIEDIDGVRVYYSLGNFVFDQYWEPQVRCGLAVTARVRKTNDTVTVDYTDTQVGMRPTGETAVGCR